MSANLTFAMLEGKFYILALLFTGLLTFAVEGRPRSGAKSYLPRQRLKPIRIGKWSSKNKRKHSNSLKSLFKKGKNLQKRGNVLAILLPFDRNLSLSSVAAACYHQISNNKFRNIFLLMDSNSPGNFDGGFIFLKNFITPLGTVKTDIELCKKLIRENSCFVSIEEDASAENVIQEHLSFLQSQLGNELDIVPIIQVSENIITCQAIANALKPYFDKGNLFVFSSRLTGYPNDEDLNFSKGKLFEAIQSNSPENFLRFLNKVQSPQTPNLQSETGQLSSLFTLLNLTCDRSDITFNLVDSGDPTLSQSDNNPKLTGSVALVVESNPQEGVIEILTQGEKLNLLSIARQSIEVFLKSKAKLILHKDQLTSGLIQKAGAFVTLHVNGKLRGCMGSFSCTQPLFKLVQEMAVSSAVKDSRFVPICLQETNELEIEISVLSAMKKIQSIDEFIPGRDGIYIRKGNSGGTFLPQVANLTGWSKEELLGHCATEKVGLEWDGWGNADLYTYQAVIFSEKVPTN